MCLLIFFVFFLLYATLFEITITRVVLELIALKFAALLEHIYDSIFVAIG